MFRDSLPRTSHLKVLDIIFPPTHPNLFVTHDELDGTWGNCLEAQECQESVNLEEQSVQFSSVAQSCPTLCDPMNRSTPGLPVHHQLPEFTQTQAHQVSDAIQPSHPLSSPSPPAQREKWVQKLRFPWVLLSSTNLKIGFDGLAEARGKKSGLLRM